jgi:DNA-binding CsgD family transcriptional regulator
MVHAFIARQSPMPAHEALKDLSTLLSHAASAEDIGRALLKVANRFHLKQSLIIDNTKLFDRVGPAIIFSTHTKGEVENFDKQRPFVHHPFTQRARISDRPFLISAMRKALGPATEERWRSLMPPSVQDSDGILVPVHDHGQLAWIAAFAGKNADLSAAAQAVMSAAVHAGYSLFRQLLEGNVPQSPLTPRESECLHWVGEGKTDSEVGKILHISGRTVRFHINNAKRKLGVASRIQAVAKRVAGVR